MRQIRVNRRRIDRVERTARRFSDQGVCYRHALKGVRDVPATHGQLCKPCFEGAWVHA